MDKHRIKATLDLPHFLRSRYGTVFNRNGWATCLFADLHENGDIHPSMQLSKDGRTVKCWAGDHLDGWADCFQVVMLKERVLFPEALQRCAELLGLDAPPNGRPVRHILRRFQWVDAAGQVAWHLRWEPGKPKFTWAQDQDNKHPGLGACEPTVYGLREVDAAENTILVEGERDTDTLNAWLTALGRTDVVATTTAYGGSDVKPAFLAPLHGKARVYLSGDRDKVGRMFLQQCETLLQHHVNSLCVLDIPDGFKDWTEWAEAGGTAEQFHKLLETALRVESSTQERAALTFTPLHVLLNEPEEHVPFLVDSRLPRAGISALVAKPKVGKSTMARNLALCVARGRPWLGFSTAQGPVLYLALEEKRGEVRKHFVDMGATDEDPVFVYCAPSPADGVTLLREEAERKHPALIIVDPLLKMIRVKDANDYAAVTAALEPLVTLGRETGAHVLTVHHLGKGERDGGDAILGSTAIFAAVDTALILKRLEKYRTLKTIQRYGDELEETVLTFDQSTRTVGLGDPKERADVGSLKTALLDHLRTQPDPLTEAELNEAIEGRTTLKRKAIRELHAERVVDRLGKGGRGDPFRYRLSDPCSVVPSIYGEQGNKKPKTGVPPQQIDAYSCSHDFDGLTPHAKTREQENNGVVIDVD